MKRENLVEQHEFIISNPLIHKGLVYDNLILEAKSDKTMWIEETTKKIGDWRGIFRSSYIKWALAINGLFLAKEKYEREVDNETFLFQVKSLRQEPEGAKQTTIAEWDAAKAAKVHFDTVPMICTYGFTDLYNCLEEFVFDFYRIYWRYNPDSLIKGTEFRHLRKLKEEANGSEESNALWEKSFNERLDNWQRKRLYNNLGKVFLSYCNEAGIKKPKNYKISTPETWAESITGISVVRNTIVHGGKVVSKELGEFCKTPYSLGFDFVEGEELKITLTKLQMVELFTNQLLTALNISLSELYVKLEE
jgi:hypothetical protein